MQTPPLLCQNITCVAGYIWSPDDGDGPASSVYGPAPGVDGRYGDGRGHAAPGWGHVRTAGSATDGHVWRTTTHAADAV